MQQRLIKKLQNGQTIPNMIDGPLTLEQIPTKNQLRIIDNYSPKYNYIVEGDKIYYGKKGQPYWRDISNNDTARRNLYEFLNNKYQFRGYEDGEKDIYAAIQEGTYNYNDRNKKPKVKDVPPIDISSLLINNQQNSPQVKYFSVGPILGPVQPSKSNKKSKTSKEFKSTEESKTIPIITGSTLGPIIQSSIQPDVINNEVKRIKNSIKNSIKNTILDPEIMKNGKSRKFKLWFGIGNDDAEVELEPIQTEGYKIATDMSIMGDTIPIPKDSRKYIIPENINASEYKFGFRNRGDYNPIVGTHGAAITAFTPFKLYDNLTKPERQDANFIGIDKNGNLKAGTWDIFGPGDYLTTTYQNNIIGPKRDENGNLVWKNDIGHGNLSYYVPVILVQNEDGTVSEGSLNILSNRRQKKGTKYGSVSGGRAVVKLPDNTYRILSGPVEKVFADMEQLKEQYNLPYLSTFTLDNGSYNRGLRTRDEVLNSSDLHWYDKQNHGDSGNFLYLIPRSQSTQFKSDSTFYNRSLARTEQDASYQSGHPLQNEMKGIVLHHTAYDGQGKDVMGSIVGNWARQRSGNAASAQVIIDKDGTRYIVTEPNDVAFHAGYSAWNQGDSLRTNVNDFMTGIEFQGDTNRQDLTEAQIQSAVEYLRPIIQKYKIPLDQITTHEVIRNLFNQYAQEKGLKTAPSKSDINQRNYQRIIQALIDSGVYYKAHKQGGTLKLIKKYKK